MQIRNSTHQAPNIWHRVNEASGICLAVVKKPHLIRSEALQRCPRAKYILSEKTERQFDIHEKRL